jgi:hypothetical protein
MHLSEILRKLTRPTEAREPIRAGEIVKLHIAVTQEMISLREVMQSIGELSADRSL